MGPCVLKSRKGKKRKKKETEMKEMKKNFHGSFFFCRSRVLLTRCGELLTLRDKIIFEDSMICSSSKF